VTNGCKNKVIIITDVGFEEEAQTLVDQTDNNKLMYLTMNNRNESIGTDSRQQIVRADLPNTMHIQNNFKEPKKEQANISIDRAVALYLKGETLKPTVTERSNYLATINLIESALEICKTMGIKTKYNRRAKAKRFINKLF
jgi:hypothetical protein